MKVVSVRLLEETEAPEIDVGKTRWIRPRAAIKTNDVTSFQDSGRQGALDPEEAGPGPRDCGCREARQG